ncbi:MAG: hypothetical protein IPM35_08040 [Myxococcales bacterium]|nr:hypothetical protein [Myxococcales bacterium]
MEQRDKLDVQVASALAAKIQLQDVMVLSVEAKHVGMIDAPEPLLSYTVPRVAAVWEHCDQSVVAVFPFCVYVEALPAIGAEQSERVRLAEVGVTLRIEYLMKPGALEGGFNEEALRHYVGISGYMHAWPYFRAEVQWLTSKLGFPGLVLPVILSGQAAARVQVAQISGGTAPGLGDAMLDRRKSKLAKTREIPSDVPR